MSGRTIRLTALSMIALLAAVVVLLDIGGNMVRAVLVVPLVLLLPGLALVDALFSRRVPDAPARLLLGLGLSLAVTALGGILLNWLPGGLQQASWVTLLGGSTVAVNLVALLRHQPNIAPAIIRRAERRGLPNRTIILFGLAACVTALAYGLARGGAAQQQTDNQAITQLWLLPADSSDGRLILVGVRNMGSAPVSYRLLLRQGEAALAEWDALELAGNQSWEFTFELPETYSNAKAVEAVLYRMDSSDDIFRRVFLRSQ